MNFNNCASLVIFFIILVLFYSVFVFEHEAIYTIRVLAVFDVYYRKLTIELSVKTFKTRTVHFIFSLSLFVCARVVITSITALGMFTNLCLVLLLLLVGSLVPKFHLT